MNTHVRDQAAMPGKASTPARAAMLVLSLLAASMASVATGAAAQDRIDEARRLTELGRMAEARTLLRTELDETPSPAAAFNLALVEHSVGDFEAAEGLFVRLLANEFGDLPDDRRQRAGELMAASVAEMGTIVLRWDAALPATIRVDGRPKGRLVRGETLRVRVNPGVHVVNAQSEDIDVVRELEVERASAFPVTLGAPNNASERDSVLDINGDAVSDQPAPRRWPWAIAIGAVLVGGAVLATVLLTRGSSPSSTPDHYVGLVEF